jgi:hypothetical protein
MRWTSHKTRAEGLVHHVRIQVAHRAPRKVTRPRPNLHSLVVLIDAIYIHAPTPALLIYSWL